MVVSLPSLLLSSRLSAAAPAAGVASDAGPTPPLAERAGGTQAAPPQAVSDGGGLSPTGATPSLIGAAAAVPGGAASQGLFPYPLDVRTLKNGLKVVLVPTGPGGLCAYFTLMRVGARNEVEEGHTGFAHFFEHMMFRGTEAYPPEKYSQALQGVGVAGNAETSDDFTLFTTYGPTEALPTVITVEADRFQHLKYGKDAFRTEAKAVLGEYAKDIADPDTALDEALRKAAFKKSTYRHNALGFLADIKRMPEQYDYSLKFFKRWYVPGNATIFVVGDFAPDQIFGLITQAYGDWSGKVSNVKIPKEPEQQKAVSQTLRWKTQTLPRVLVGFHAPSLGTDLKKAAIQNLLGPFLFGPASALYKSLVLDQHLAVALNPGYQDHREPSLFELEAVAKDEAALQHIQDAIAKAIAQLQEAGPDEKLLDAVKQNLHYGELMGLESASAIAGLLGVVTAPTGDPATLDQLARAMGEVTPADVQAFAQKFLVPKNETTIVLRPPSVSPSAGAAAGGAL